MERLDFRAALSLISGGWGFAFPFYSKGGFSLSRNFYARSHLNFPLVNKIEAMYERSRVFTFPRGLPCIASTLFMRVRT